MILMKSIQIPILILTLRQNLEQFCRHYCLYNLLCTIGVVLLMYTAFFTYNCLYIIPMGKFVDKVSVRKSVTKALKVALFLFLAMVVLIFVLNLDWVFFAYFVSAIVLLSGFFGFCIFYLVKTSPKTHDREMP